MGPWVEFVQATARAMRESTTMTERKTESPVPYLVVKGAAEAIDFYVQAFGATERFRLAGGDGKVGHAELELFGGPLLLADEWPEGDVLAPPSRGGTAVSIHVVVGDGDAVVARAEEAGATVERPPADQFYGNFTWAWYRYYRALAAVAMDYVRRKRNEGDE